MGDSPVNSFRIGNVEAAILGNKPEDGDRTFYSTTLSRHYKDGEEWKTAQNFSHSDLPLVQRLSERAERWIAQQQPES